jgi:hypothetical protein
MPWRIGIMFSHIIILTVCYSGFPGDQNLSQGSQFSSSDKISPGKTGSIRWLSLGGNRAKASMITANTASPFSLSDRSIIRQVGVHLTALQRNTRCGFPISAEAEKTSPKTLTSNCQFTSHNLYHQKSNLLVDWLGRAISMAKVFIASLSFY